MRTARSAACGLGAALVVAAGAAADVRMVGTGQPYPTIQEAIDAAAHGDTILVMPGTYAESINFLGKAITVRGRDGAEWTFLTGQGQAVTLARFVSGETPASVLQGFTLRDTEGKFGALAIDIAGASPRILDCVIRGHVIDSGGAARVAGGSPDFVNCLFTENIAVNISAVGASGPGRTRMINCTVTGNAAFNSISGPVDLFNSIVWGNSGPEALPGATAVYSNIEHFKPEPFPGMGNIKADPLLVVGSRLGPGSPCIDSGNSAAYDRGPLRDLGGAPRGADVAAAADTGVGPWPIIDMGAYEASSEVCRVDFDGNASINSNDISAYLAEWLVAVSMGCP